MANYAIVANQELVATFRIDKDTFDTRFKTTRQLADAIMADRPELSPCKYISKYEKIDGLWHWVLSFYLVDNKLTYTEI